MSVIFAKPATSQVSTSIGTIKALGGPGAKVRMNLNSIKNDSDKAPRLVVTVINAQGEEARFLCSPAVSSAFRSKEIDLKQLVNYPITEQMSKEYVNDEGEVIPSTAIYVITKPASVIETSLDSIAEEKIQSSIVEFQDAAW